MKQMRIEQDNTRKLYHELCQKNEAFQNLLKREQEKNRKLEFEIAEKMKILKFLFSDDQIEHLEGKRRKWEKESIIKGLKFRFSLGVNGYQFLRKNNFPLPGYSTLTKKTRELRLDYGVFSQLSDALKCKVSSMNESEKCVFSFYFLIIFLWFFCNVTLLAGSVFYHSMRCLYQLKMILTKTKKNFMGTLPLKTPMRMTER